MTPRSTGEKYSCRRRPSSRPGSWFGLGALLATAGFANSGRADTAGEGAKLLDLPIEQLMDIEVTSVGKKPQKLGEAAAAIYVITQEDIRRSGVFTIPDLLRQVPGLSVAQLDSHHWAISSRGLNAVYSAKLLVLVDGRSVYSPVFSGVFWGVQAVPLRDIERIEVIRGPGATLWGANAVNGVINIITKNAQNTPGLAASVTGGTAGAGSVSLRYGGALSDKVNYRLYADAINYATLAPRARDDAAVEERAGARFDVAASAADTVSAQGEYYQERTRDVLYLPSLVAPVVATGLVQHESGGHALVSWDHSFSATSDITLKAYFDSATTQDYTADITVNTYDVEIQHRFQLGARHDVIWGAGYRNVSYTSEQSAHVFFAPSTGHQDIFNTFIQDDYSLLNNLHLVGGIKVEHNTYTGWELEPSLRMAWQPGLNHTIWAAVSRAVRVPSIGEEFGIINVSETPGSAQSPPIQVAILGDSGLRAEQLTSWEAGYRSALTARLSLDVTAFYNRYASLTSTVLGSSVLEFTPFPPHVLAPLQFGNLLRGETHGGELSANWQVTPAWRLIAGYALLLGDIVGDNPALSLTPQPNAIGTSPQNQFQVRSHVTLPWRTEFDAAVYRVDSVPAERVDAYTRLDLRLGWQPTARLAFSLAGQNLLQARHAEFLPVYYETAKQVPRTVYLTAAVGF